MMPINAKMDEGIVLNPLTNNIKKATVLLKKFTVFHSYRLILLGNVQIYTKNLISSLKKQIYYHQIHHKAYHAQHYNYHRKRHPDLYIFTEPFYPLRQDSTIPGKSKKSGKETFPL